MSSVALHYLIHLDRKRASLILIKLDKFAGSTEANEPKYMANFPYPYMNGVLHVGHAFSLSKASFISGLYDFHYNPSALTDLCLSCSMSFFWQICWDLFVSTILFPLITLYLWRGICKSWGKVLWFAWKYPLYLVHRKPLDSWQVAFPKITCFC